MTSREFEKLPLWPRYDGRKWKNTTSAIKPRGPWNLGNTCWMNTVIQCLMRCEIFVTELEKLGRKTKCEQVATALRELLVQLREPTTISPCDPSSLFCWCCQIKDCEHFKELEQQDAREFLEMLLTHWNAGDNRVKRISEAFEGEVLSIIRCPKCNWYSRKWEKCDILSVSLRAGRCDTITNLLEKFV